ncbi:hypothetical protein B0G69_3728 [Paraburkholderia sp. RAU2J]|uniref:DUF2971 domain-containing protein n=1 Tax=Paraburkholderia sp. RAU2J TaxID=1938810 RepID=UPI000EB16BC9|nr:DUF2971 domain-containing protein [Paraburkholderia sp. RAU2J]RKT20432.1 hypothetical protein B0G69_3728 [Paraburkholderia sp. RAU2J]
MLYKFFSEPDAERTDRFDGIAHDGQLWVASPHSFNDPFEFKVVLDLEADEETHRTHFMAQKPGSTEAEFQSWRGNLNGGQWYIEQAIRADLLASIGVACFTEHWENELLWAHYGRNHTGFCVGFDETALTSWSEVTGHGKIQYAVDAPIYHPFKEKAQLFAYKAAFQKSFAWAYESEYRLLFRKSSVLIDLPEGAVREIIVGCRAPLILRDRARALAKSTASIEVYQAAENLRAFSIGREIVEENVFSMTSHF